jgi:hypothetical protein
VAIASTTARIEERAAELGDAPVSATSVDG